MYVHMCMFRGCRVIVTTLSLDHYQMCGQKGEWSLGWPAANVWKEDRSSCSLPFIWEWGKKAEQENSCAGKQSDWSLGIKALLCPWQTWDEKSLRYTLVFVIVKCRSSSGVSPKSPTEYLPIDCQLLKIFGHNVRDSCHWMGLSTSEMLIWARYLYHTL